MSVEILSAPGAILTIWGKPTRSDIDQVAAKLKDAARAMGAPVFYVTVVPEDAPNPDPEVQRYLNSQLKSLEASCSCYHVVLEGEGFVPALKRGVLLTIFQFIRRRKFFFVHANSVELLKNLSPPQASLATRLFSDAKRLGFLPDRNDLKQSAA
jgi:hypothetical protein